MMSRNRYDTSDSLENQFEPGSGGRVLRNLLKIKSKRRMDRFEAEAYARVFEKAVKLYGKSHKFSAADICNLHRFWLGEIYLWAGSCRTVNIAKGDFQFATARHIPSLMAEFEKKVLACYTPCKGQSLEKAADSLAAVHTELVLIHPFREGNGRLARLLAVLMALQAGLPLFDFESIRGRKKQEYFLAVRSGLEKNYSPMRQIFLEIIQRSFKRVSG
jgi:cell filamentation protein